ncbi:DUF3520 domain-containing protein [bacterium]|nr:DUF3520 domain-containing protein [bacterium]
MTNPSFNPDDPRLTAFVLGELDAADRAAVEELLESSSEARTFVDDLQGTIGILRDELSAEPAPALTNEQRAALQRTAESVSDAASVDNQGAVATRPAAATGTHSRRGLLVGMVATVAALAVVVAVLPQFADQRLSDSSVSPWAATHLTGNKISSLASAASSGPIDEADGSVRGTQPVTIRDITQLEKSRELPAESGLADHAASTVARSKFLPADRLEAEGGKVLLQLQPEEQSGSQSSTPIRVTVQDQPVSDSKADHSGPARANAIVSTGSSSRLAATPDPAVAAGVGGAVGGEGRATGSVSRVARTSPAAPAPFTDLPGGSATSGRPMSGPPVSAAAGIAVNAPAKPATALLPGGSDGSTVNRFSSEAKAVSGQAAMPAQAAAARGPRLQPATPQLADQERVSRVDRLATTVVGEALKESERNEGIRGRRMSILNKTPFIEPPAQWGRGFGGGGFGRQAGNETYEPIVENEFVVPDPKDAEKRLSTISVDVDTASYANVRRFLMQNQLPPPNAVRIEELVNYFKYDYPQPKGADPFSVTTEVMLCPWQPGHRLARIGLQAKTIDKSQRPPTNLVFLLDVSGSMRPANKLPLVQQAMRLLVEEMTEDDQIAIVTYASNAGLRLASTPGSKKPEILQAIDALTAGGSTNGEGGIKLAYDTAIRQYIQDGANRVILCTDGDFNVGVSNDNELVELIQEKAASGVFLSVFGFGMGNLKDGKLEKLADKGNGQYGYIDNLQEARRAFKEGLAGTLYTVAKDVKLQAEFNPATVGAYRLIGYENRKLAAADFTDDTKDAGEIGAGHTVTALYEIVPRQVLIDRLKASDLRYGDTFELSIDAPKIDGFSNELFFVRLRYKKPDQETSQPVEADFPVNDIAITGKSLATPDADFQFAAAVASFGMNLRNSQYRGNWDLRRVYDVAVQTRSEDADGRRAEFIDLVQRALRIIGQPIDAEPLEASPVTRPVELSAAEARIKAAVDGKYRRLLKKIEVRDDLQQYGAFHDFGFWDKSTEYKGHRDLLPGYWVYVYPHWYIWGEVDETRVASPQTKPAEAASEPAKNTAPESLKSPEKQ